MESIQNDLHVAQEIQQTILPKTFPPFPELKSFDLYAYMNAAKYVGGDFYDFFRIDQDRLGFVIALIGVLMFCFADSKSSLAYVIAAHVVLMIGCPLAMSPSQTHALNALAGPESADGSTIMNTLQQIVGAIATALATSFLKRSASV